MGEYPQMETKRCSKCEEVKPTSEYYRCAKSRDKLMWVCKTCSNAKSNDWRKKNPERNNAHRRKFRKKQRSIELPNELAKMIDSLKTEENNTYAKVIVSLFSDISALRTGLHSYGAHRYTCTGNPGPCSCGLYDVIRLGRKYNKS